VWCGDVRWERRGWAVGGEGYAACPDDDRGTGARVVRQGRGTGEMEVAGE